MSESDLFTYALPSTPPRRSGSAPNPPSPADAYRERRREIQEVQVEGEEAAAAGQESESKIRSPPPKSRRVTLPTFLCSMCRCEFTGWPRKIGLGARVVFALVAKAFVRGLVGDLRACETCNKALQRAQDLLSALERSVVSVPDLNQSSPALPKLNFRAGVGLLSKLLKTQPGAVEAQIRSLEPQNGWAVVPAIAGLPDCGLLELLKDPGDSRYGTVKLCGGDPATGLVEVMDVIGGTRFHVQHFRLAPLPDPGVPRGIAAAPWAERAGAMRTKESLRAAKAVVSDLSAEKSLLEAQLHASTLQHRREGRKSTAAIDELSGQLAVAHDRAAWAYQQGMGDFKDLEGDRQLQKLRIDELEAEVAQVPITCFVFVSAAQYNHPTDSTQHPTRSDQTAQGMGILSQRREESNRKGPQRRSSCNGTSSTRPAECQHRDIRTTADRRRSSSTNKKGPPLPLPRYMTFLI